MGRAESVKKSCEAIVDLWVIIGCPESTMKVRLDFVDEGQLAMVGRVHADGRKIGSPVFGEKRLVELDAALRSQEKGLPIKRVVADRFFTKFQGFFEQSTFVENGDVRAQRLVPAEQPWRL